MSLDGLVASIKLSYPYATSTVGALYGSAAKKDQVMVIGAAALITDPKKRSTTPSRKSRPAAA
jgi:hypothetical protein